MKRKTPRIHRVKTHVRKNKRVKSYLRGVRKHTTLSKPTINWKKGKETPKGYTVTLKYSDTEKEEIKVIATNYHRAIDEAFEEKTDKRIPIEINVVDPSLGEIIHWAGSRALKYGKLAASKALEKAKELHEDYTTRKLLEQSQSGSYVEREMAKRKLSRLEEKKQRAKAQTSDISVQQLIDQAYSKNKTAKTFARAKLRKEYPHVWDVMDISRT